MNITADTRLIDLTAGQLGYFIKDILKVEKQPEQQDVELLHGIGELADLVGWSYAKTQIRVSEGFFDEALYKNERSYSFDKIKVLEILKAEPKRKPKTARYRR